MTQTNEEMILEYITNRNLKQSSHYQLKTILNDYSKFNNLLLYELILEAEKDEDNKIRWKHRQLKHRLTSYMQYINKRMQLSSAKMYMNKIKSFYYFHEIEIHQLPKFNPKNSNLADPVTYQDLPNRTIIKSATEISEPLIRCIILHICSSGMSRVDTLHLTIQDFINAVKEYTTADNITNILIELQGQDVIPTWTNRRTKTNKYYITFTTPEATSELINYLQIRNQWQPLKPTDKLFKITPDWLTRKFQKINNNLGLGKVGNYNRFRTHNLRKFHASNLKKCGMSEFDINVLQGKSNGAVNDVYFFEDATALKEKYVQAIEGVLIFTDVNNLNIYSKEFQQLQKQNELLLSKLDEFNKLKNDIEDIRSWYIMD